MIAKSTIIPELIAPCGMNCAICIGHMREKNKCFGCRGIDENKPKGCRKCVINSCQLLKKNRMLFCSEKCEEFPCTRLKNLDKRYRLKYGMSMIENLKNIDKSGISKFVNSEQKRWKCTKCGNLLCVHRDSCLECGEKR